MMTSTTRKCLTRAWRALTLAAAFVASGLPAYAQGPSIDAVVEKALRDGRDLPVIVRYRTDAAFENAKKGSGSGRREITRHSRALRALSLKANHRALRELVEERGVAGISYDAPVKGSLFGLLTSTTTGVSVEASGSTAARDRYQVTGKGINVAVIDSGVQPHTDLPATRIVRFVDFVNGKSTPYDDYGHGTHVAGIVAGSGSASSGKYAGVAPGAGIVALKVLDKTGAGSTSSVIAALEYVLASHASLNIRVVNLSLGHPIYESAATDPLVQMVNALSRRGVVVVVAAGNMGRNALGQTVYGSITSPGNAQGAITVGATDTKYTLPRNDDAIASFSSRGPTRYDRYVKPDVVAPGYHIVSLLAPYSTLASKYPEYKVSSGYFRLNGTSMAAPAVAGQAALVLSANPKLTANAVKGIVQYTSQRMRDIDVMSQGLGQVNVAGAVRLAKLIVTDQPYEKRWVKGSRKPVAADLLFGETAVWGRAMIAAGELTTDVNSLYVRLAQWDDNIVWSMWDNIVWSMDDNIVWSMGDNIVWSMWDNIVWSMEDEALVWGLTDDNIVWGFDDNIVWSMWDNIVWSMDNIVWSMDSDSVQALDSDVMGYSVEGDDDTDVQEGGEQ